MKHFHTGIIACKSLTLSFLILTFALLVSSCGYRMIGSQSLPFDSLTIKHVQNKTYEPRLEERLHNALSAEFINQGIEIRAEGGDVELEATVITYMVGAIAAIDEIVKEQDISMNVDIKMIDKGRVTDFRSMASPIRITYQSTGSVTQSVAEKEMATDKACREIAKEIVSRIILGYVK